MKKSGLYFLLEGFKLIFTRGIKRFVFLPFLLNLLIIGGLFWLANAYILEFSEWLQAFLPDWLQWLGSLLWWIFFIGFFLVAIYFFVALANIVGAPFYNVLAEKVELHLTGKLISSDNFSLKTIPIAIGRQLKIVGYYLPKAFLLLILFFIPVISIIAPPLWFLLNAWFMALQTIDYPTDNHRLPISTVISRLKQKRLLTLTFGMSILFFAMIPIVNFFVIPAAVAGATKLWLEEFKAIEM